MGKYYKYLFTFIFTTLLASKSFCQTNNSEYRNIIPGKEFQASGINKIIFGTNWRDLWTEPIQVKLLKLTANQEGLLSYAIQDSTTGNYLILLDGEGNRWKFKSIYSEPSKLLPVKMSDYFVNSVLKDQVSTSNPYSSLISAHLLKSVGLLPSDQEPQLVLCPNDDSLGKFSSKFGTIELYPNETNKQNSEINKNRLKTKNLLNEIDEKYNNIVNSKEYLKERLMDIFMGDWDRHPENWEWEKLRIGNYYLWSLNRASRDKAFINFEGFGPTIVEYIVPNLTSFTEDYPDIEKLTWNGRFLDRRFLSELTRPEWSSMTAFLQGKLTDKAIIDAVRKMPVSAFKKEGPRLIHTLIERRKKLKKISDDFYEMINKVVDIYGKNKSDLVLVTRLSNDSTSIEIFERKENHKNEEGIQYFSKTFYNNITDEIRIYLLDGNDKVIIKGKVEEGPLVRIIAGDGKNIFVDSSEVKGKWLSVFPIPDAENQNRYYGKSEQTKLVEGPSTKCYNEKIVLPKALEYHELSQRDRGNEWVFYPLADYDSDNGVTIGATAILYSYNFLKSPYEYEQSLSAAYAFKPNSYMLEYEGKFIDVFEDVDLGVYMSKSELEFTRYYGYGNNTPFSLDLQNNDYYRLNQDRIIINPAFLFNLTKGVTFSAGLFFEYNNSNVKSLELLNTFKDTSYGKGIFKTIGANSNLLIDTRDNDLLPHTGLFLNVGGRYYSGVLGTKSSFVQSYFDLRTYFTFKFPNSTTLAFRSGGERVFGKYPFYKAAFLGGGDNLRGYARERFAGDASLFGQTEFRTDVADLKWIFKGTLGLSGFLEAGRVFAENETSKKWHSSYGGGIYMSYLNNELIINFSYGKSPEDHNLYLDLGMAF